MLDQLFLKLLNMSISAGWLALVVMVLRPFMKRVPKAIHCLLWGLVGLRLIWPFSIESILSLLPSAQTVPPEIVYEQSPAIQSGVPAINAVVNPILSESSAANPMTSVNPLQIWLFLAENLWVLGMVVLFLYAAISYLRIALKVRARLPLGDGIFVCDGVDTPFILGVIRPKIFLPSSLGGEEQAYVIAHEQAHLKRKDHWWKPLGFLLLTVHWFNPLMWIAYILLCRDIEMACDERVIREMGIEDKKAYSRALLQCSAPRRLISACPLAFGEVGVAQRVRSVLHYKKPAFWIILVALLTSITLAVCFLTDPKDHKVTLTSATVVDSGCDLKGVTVSAEEFDLISSIAYLKLKWNNGTDQPIELCRSFGVLTSEGGTWVDRSLVDSSGAVEQTVPAGGSTYNFYDLRDHGIAQSGRFRIQVPFLSAGKTYYAWVEFELKDQKLPEPSVQKITSAQEGVTAKVRGIDLQSSTPYIELEWSNESDKPLWYSRRPQISSDDYDVKCNITTEYGEPPELAAHSKAIHRYPLRYQWFPGTGTYRFHAAPVTVEFQVTKNVPVISDRIYAPGQPLYTDGETAVPCIRLIEYSTGYRLLVQDQNQWIDHGAFDEAVLEDHNFDGRFQNEAFKQGAFDPKALRAKNARAWEMGANANADRYHIFLRQKDGSFYYGIGSNGSYKNPYGIDDGYFIQSFAPMEPVNEVPQDLRRVSQLNFTYAASKDDFKPTIQLFPDTLNFVFNYQSTYIYGTFKRDGKKLILFTDSGDEYLFEIKKTSLVFKAAKSAPVDKEAVPNGAVFATGTIGTLEEYLPDGEQNWTALQTVSSHPGVSMELTSVIGEEITVTWINESDQEIEFGNPFKLYRSEGEEWVEPLRGEAVFELPAYPLSPGKKVSHVYPIHHYDISMAGLYRFESEFAVGREEHTIRIEFQLNEGIANYEVRLYNPIAMTYAHGGFSFVQTAGGAPCIALREHQNGISLQIYERNAWQDCGLATPITLTEENFDQRFTSAQIWEEKTDAATLRKNNKIAYEVKQDGCLYLVLEQMDGTVYYAAGHYDIPELVNPNQDASFIRWLYCTEAVLSIPAEKKKVTALYFTYPNSTEPMAPALNLFLADQSFDFCYSVYSSYLAYGHYERVGDDLILKTKDGLNTYTFKIQGQTLVFDAARSSKLPEYKDSNNVPQPSLPDGAVFETGMEGETIDDYVPKT